MSKLRFVNGVVLALLVVMLAASFGEANPGGAVAAEQARRAAVGRTATEMGEPTPHLRAIATQRQTPQSFTGLPAGAMGGVGSEPTEPPDPSVRTIMSGEPAPPLIGQEMVGKRFSQVADAARHVGFGLVQVNFSPNVVDTPYTFALMNGTRRVATLYFNHSMSLVVIR